MASNESNTQRARDIAPTGVRLPPGLRDELLRQATINSRSLSQEITQRLALSLDPKAAASAAAAHSATVLHINEPPKQFSDMHRQLSALFDALTPDKQLALLTLLRR